MPTKALRFLLPMMIALFLLIVGSATAVTWNTFGFDEGKAKSVIRLKYPAVPLSPQEQEALYEGKPIVRMFDSPDKLKKGYIRFFAPFDPVTAWMVCSDTDQQDLEDPAFPKSGSLTEKKRTFMPFVFDCALCEEKGEKRMYQLLVMPLVAPRRLCITYHHDTTAFPWEAYWIKASDPICCASKHKPQMAKYYDQAVVLKRNEGGWHISPLPKKFRRKPADIMRADCTYFIDTNPGGDLSKLRPLVNKATKIGSEALMKNVIFHGQRWEQHLAKYFGPAMVEKYKGWQKQYKEAMAGQ